MRTTRRKLLAGVGATAVGGIAISQTSSEANAQVEMTDLSVPNQEEVTTQEIQDVLLSVSGMWSYSGNVVPDEWEATLEAGNAPDTTHPLATVSEAQDLSKEDSGEFTLTGSLLDSPHYDMSNFALQRAGDEKSTPFVAALDFTVKRDGDVVAQARAVDNARITVSREAVSVDANIQAEGGVTVQTDG